ncbi:MAG: hypothetical protein U0264_07005 [Candidatus Kapaibacterium sp.]
MTTLFDECIELIGSDVVILDKFSTKTIVQNMDIMFPFTTWGRVDWDNQDLFERKVPITIIQDIYQYIDIPKNDLVYIVWDNGTLPVIITKLLLVIQYVEDITCVSFDTWIFSPDERWILEFYHEGEITFGKLK